MDCNRNKLINPSISVLWVLLPSGSKGYEYLFHIWLKVTADLSCVASTCWFDPEDWLLSTVEVKVVPLLTEGKGNSWLICLLPRVSSWKFQWKLHTNWQHLTHSCSTTPYCPEWLLGSDLNVGSQLACSPHWTNCFIHETTLSGTSIRCFRNFFISLRLHYHWAGFIAVFFLWRFCLLLKRFEFWTLAPHYVPLQSTYNVFSLWLCATEHKYCIVKLWHKYSIYYRSGA